MPLPSKADLLAWIRENPTATSKRDIGRAFGIKGADRIGLKAMLRELEEAGEIEGRKKRVRPAGDLPPVAVLRVIGPDADGDLWAEPTDDSPPLKILLFARAAEAPAEGDRVLARMAKSEDPEIDYEARVIRRIGQGAPKVLGVFRRRGEGGRIVPVERGSDKEWEVRPGDTEGARDGELVEAETAKGRRLGLPQARIVARLGDPQAPRSVSLIAIHAHGIPDHFPAEVTEEAEAAAPASPEDRTDLRDLPLLTIDPADARDHDDAVAAIAHADGYTLWIAIADVAHYVPPGSALDREARHRGNSTYFPDRVVPMLPEALSGDLCSLHDGVDRPCLAVEVEIDRAGSKRRHRFHRGMMRSRASLTYEQAQAFAEGSPDATTAPLAPALGPLFDAYTALAEARARRQPLDLDLPERRIVLSPEGEVTSVAFRDRFDAHKLVEEFMILANVCAAETLEGKRRPFVYRVHEEPPEDKIESLREILEGIGHSLAKGQVLRTRDFNRVLDDVAGTANAELVNLSVLRSMTQAYYAPVNLGHFGLALGKYAHFTSPIRRYADLIVHRALIAAHGWDEMRLEEGEALDATAEHISQTERRSMLAERETTDRYLAAFLSERVGGEFEGRVSGIARFGLFVKLDDTGADGLVPISRLGAEYFRHDAERQTLTGERSGRVITLGQRCLVRLAEATPVTGGLLFDLLEIEAGKPARRARPKGPNPKRKLVRVKRAARAARRR